MRCAVFGCNSTNKTDKTLRFYHFPKDAKFLKQWVHFCRRKDNFNTKFVQDIRADSNNNPTFTWVNHLSEGGLSKPTSNMMLHMTELEKIFNEFNGQTITIRQNYIAELLQLADEIDCDVKVKKLFFRSRMYFRIRKLNEEIVEQMRTKKKKT